MRNKNPYFYKCLFDKWNLRTENFMFGHLAKRACALAKALGKGSKKTKKKINGLIH